MIAVPGASDSIISGWADVLEAVYNDIGGCSSYIFCFLAFCLTSLTLDLLLGRLRHHLKIIDYFKLLRMNLEQQLWYVSFLIFLAITLPCLWLTFVLIEPLSLEGHRRGWHVGGGRP